jgi:heme oxygenase (biliverdin-IX-beta and delta-forming)
LITINLLEQLKSETLSNHQQLEKHLIVKLKGMQSPEDYINILQIFYAYFGALEDRINQFIGVDQLPDYAERRKTESIKNDILALNGIVPEKATLNDLPEIQNLLQAFGALYVIEGSTLGGQAISKMVSKQLALNGDAGISFFKSYGEHTMAMWGKFKTVLERHAASQEAANVIIEAANETFGKFRLWMEKN